MKLHSLFRTIMNFGIIALCGFSIPLGNASADETTVCPKLAELSDPAQAVVKEVSNEHERLFKAGMALSSRVYSQENFLDFSNVSSKSTADERRKDLGELKETWKALADLNEDFEAAILKRGKSHSVSQQELLNLARCFKRESEDAYLQTKFGNIDRFVNSIRARQDSAEAFESIYSLVSESFGTWTLTSDGFPSFTKPGDNQTLRRLLAALLKADEEAKRFS